MKLSAVEVREFQSIRNSNPFRIGDITCLVGKNEAGKTAVLQALYRLNPIIPSDGRFDITDDYPRADVEDYQQDVEAGRRNPAIVATATFALEDDEVSMVEAEFGAGILKEHELRLSKGYDNKLSISLPVDEGVAVGAMLAAAQMPNELTQEFSGAKTLVALRARVDAKVDPGISEHVCRLKSQLEKLEQPGGIECYIYDTYLESSVPKFLYFDEYFLLKGQENIDALRARVQQNSLEKSDYPLLGLIDLARLKLDELLAPQRTEWLFNKLEGASNYLSSKVLRYWSQNKHLLMRFDVRPALPRDPQGMTTGTNIWARIYDTKRKSSTPLGTRSRGFVWFFSFLAWFNQQQSKNEHLILLLDEPGLFLHGRAQGDLLRYMEEELKGNHQVIYTTHSPFMVDPSRFDRVRIVQDRSMDSDDPLPLDQDGTKVLADVLDATEDSLFPLQGALGYDLYQTLFVGPNSLVVEGVSDLLYLQTMSGLLQSQGREGLDGRWAITPVGGAEKVPTFVALLGAQRGLRVATLVDIQRKDMQSIENLYRRKLLKKQNVHTFADFIGSTEADVEDMFDAGFYLQLVNDEYASELATPIAQNMLGHTGPRIVVALEAFFRANPPRNCVGFNHFRPARRFAENVSKYATMIPPVALQRFEAAFKALNALL